LKPSDLTLGQVVIKRVAVVELGVNNGSGDGGGCFGIEVWACSCRVLHSTQCVTKSSATAEAQTDRATCYMSVEILSAAARLQNKGYIESAEQGRTAEQNKIDG